MLQLSVFMCCGVFRLCSACLLLDASLLRLGLLFPALSVCRNSEGCGLRNCATFYCSDVLTSSRNLHPRS